MPPRPLIEEEEKDRPRTALFRIMGKLERKIRRMVKKSEPEIASSEAFVEFEALLEVSRLAFWTTCFPYWKDRLLCSQVREDVTNQVHDLRKLCMVCRRFFKVSEEADNKLGWLMDSILEDYEDYLSQLKELDLNAFRKESKLLKWTKRRYDFLADN